MSMKILNLDLYQEEVGAISFPSGDSPGSGDMCSGVYLRRRSKKKKRKLSKFRFLKGQNIPFTQKEMK